jgi:hypothetical protein
MEKRAFVVAILEHRPIPEGEGRPTKDAGQFLKAKKQAPVGVVKTQASS